MPYAYMCVTCDHPLSRHVLRHPDSSDWKLGQYRCRYCECVVGPDAPSYDMSKREFDAHMGDLA